MIIISAHRDTVIPNYELGYKNGQFKGLLDNFIGRLVSYLILSDPSIIELEKQGKITFYENLGEEFGILTNPPNVTKDDIIIVVDICAGNQYTKFDIAFENIKGVKNINDVIANLKWEGYKIGHRLYTEAIEDEDESWSWIQQKIPVFSFIIPIAAPNDNWHGNDATITIEKVMKAKDILIRTISYLI